MFCSFLKKTMIAEIEDYINVNRKFPALLIPENM